MFPNTFLMQEVVRMYFDETLDREDEGKDVETPFIYTIPRGTPVPVHLILINEYLCRFSLQPSRGMPLEGLSIPTPVWKAMLTRPRFESIIGRVLSQTWF